MKQKKFLDILSKVGYKWKINESIRAQCHNAEELCPITAVAKKVTGKFFLTSCWQAAAKKLGLHHKTAERIATAADLTTLYPRVRKKLERAVM